jgi:hypothetical protein
MVTTVDSMSSEELYAKELYCDFTLEISVRNSKPAGEEPKAGADSVETWVVATQLGGGAANAIGVVNEHMKLIPWGGAAARISPPREGIGSPGVGKQKLGSVYCSLPLPVTTNFKQNINGYFELSSNRRDIWQGSDMAGEGMTRAQWNRALLASIAAPSMIRVILATIKERGEPLPSDIYGLFPVGLDPFPDPWDAAVRSFYTEVLTYPVLHSKIKGGTWLRPQDCVLVSEEVDGYEQLLDILLQEDVPVVGLPGPLYRMFMQWAPTPPPRGSPSLLRKILREGAKSQRRNNIPACLQCPKNLKFAIHYITVDFAIEQIARKEGHESRSGGQTSLASYHPRANISNSNSSSASDDYPLIMDWHEVMHELEGIPALPLCNNEVGILRKAHHTAYDSKILTQVCEMGFATNLCKQAMDILPKGSGADDIINWILTAAAETTQISRPSHDHGGGAGCHEYYMCTTVEKELFCGREMGGIVVDVEKCSERMLALLNLTLFQQDMNVKIFERSHFVAIYKDLFPPSWHGTPEIEWSPEEDTSPKDGSKPVSLEWLKLFWSVVLSKKGVSNGNNVAIADDLPMFENTVPMVPTNNGVARILQKKTHSFLLVGSENAIRDNPKLASSISKMGLLTVHAHFEDELLPPVSRSGALGTGGRSSLLMDYFHPCRRRGLLQALHSKVRDQLRLHAQASEPLKELNGIASLVSNLNDAERAALRKFLCLEPMIDIEDSDVNTLRCLPIYAVYNYSRSSSQQQVLHKQQEVSSELPPIPALQEAEHESVENSQMSDEIPSDGVPLDGVPSDGVPLDVVHVSILPEHFMLKEDIEVKFLVYNGSESSCLHSQDASEKCLLQVLGVKALNKSEVYLVSRTRTLTRTRTPTLTLPLPLCATGQNSTRTAPLLHPCSNQLCDPSAP